MPSLSSKITRKKISKFYGLVQFLIFSVSKNEFAENGRIFTIIHDNIHDNLFTRLVTNKTSSTKSISSVNLFNLLWTYNNLLLASKTLSIIFITLVSSLMFLSFKISTFLWIWKVLEVAFFSKLFVFCSQTIEGLKRIRRYWHNQRCIIPPQKECGHFMVVNFWLYFYFMAKRRFVCLNRK